MNAVASPVDYDPFSQEVLANPWPAYARLRTDCPVHYTGDFNPPFYTLSRTADIREALTNPDRFSIRWGQSPQFSRRAGLTNDPPEHDPYRAVFNRAFTPRVVARLEAGMEALGNRLLDDMLPRGETDFQEAYASPFPTTIIAELLGIPAEEHRLFRRMSDNLTATYNEPDPAVSSPPRAAFDRYFQDVIDHRRSCLQDAGISRASLEHVGTVLPDDLISRFVVAEVEGRRLDDRDLQSTLLLLLLGGNETSAGLLTNLLWRLLEVPERWDAVKAEPELVDAVVEESLRYDSPVLGLFRVTPRAVRLHDVTIPEKSKVMLLYAAVNRDPALFEHPDEFRLDRNPEETQRRLMTFGFGHHYCPGAALARLEARTSLRLLIERAPGLRLNGKPTRIVPFNLWGRGTLPIAW